MVYPWPVGWKLVYGLLGKEGKKFMVVLRKLYARVTVLLMGESFLNVLEASGKDLGMLLLVILLDPFY